MRDVDLNSRTRNRMRDYGRVIDATELADAITYTLRGGGMSRSERDTIEYYSDKMNRLASELWDLVSKLERRPSRDITVDDVDAIEDAAGYRLDSAEIEAIRTILWDTDYVERFDEDALDAMGELFGMRTRRRHRDNDWGDFPEPTRNDFPGRRFPEPDDDDLEPPNPFNNNNPGERTHWGS
jgi:hypothetical protein